MNEPTTFLEPLAGLILDEVSKIRNHPFVPHSLTKLRNLLFCKKATGAQTVVEIGTFKGLTTRRLARQFEQVISVEIDRDLHLLAAERLKRCRNVELVLGDGCTELPKISSRISSAVLFLDGHYSGGQTGMGDEPEPVLKELKAIGPLITNYSAIVVDDFRLFGVDDGWPMKSELLQQIEMTLPHPAWSTHIMNDQIVCVRSKVGG